MFKDFVKKLKLRLKKITIKTENNCPFCGPKKGCGNEYCPYFNEWKGYDRKT